MCSGGEIEIILISFIELFINLCFSYRVLPNRPPQILMDLKQQQLISYSGVDWAVPLLVSPALGHSCVHLVGGWGMRPVGIEDVEPSFLWDMLAFSHMTL